MTTSETDDINNNNQVERDRRFIVEASLGKVAKHMRLLGYDTLYQPDYNQHYMTFLAFQQNRCIVTCSQKYKMKLDKLNNPKNDTYEVYSDDDDDEETPFQYDYCLVPLRQGITTEDQIRIVVEHYKLKFDEKMVYTRCIECNCVVIIDENGVTCPECKRVFKQGIPKKLEWLQKMSYHEPNTDQQIQQQQQ